MDTDFDRVLEIKDMDSLKWEGMKKIDKRARETTLSFWLADMDFACADEILDAIKERTDKKILGYADFDSAEYKNAVINWYKSRFNWDIAPRSIYYSPGLVTALSCFVNIMTEKGDGVIIQRPSYPPFARVVEKSGRIVVNNRLINENGRYSIDFDDFEEKCRDNKLFLFCSPHNPTGRVWTEEELKRVADICIRNNVFVVSDEIHCDLTRSGIRHYNLWSLYGKEHKHMAATCTASSKSFNIAGLSQSNVIIDCPDVRRRWEEYTDSIGMCSPSPLALAATYAAYTKCGGWLSQAVSYIDSNMDFIDSYIRSKMPDVGFYKPEGTYLAWLDFRKYGTSEQVFSLLLDKADVMVQRGTDFGNEEGDGFIRLNAACPKKILQEGLNRISRVLGH